MIDPRDLADRIIHDIDPEELTLQDKLRLAEILLSIAQVDETRLANLLEALRVSPLGDVEILRAVIRRKLRVLPPPPGIRDGLTSNGGT